jgi:hypothetical protein
MVSITISCILLIPANVDLTFRKPHSNKNREERRKPWEGRNMFMALLLSMVNIPKL